MQSLFQILVVPHFIRQLYVLHFHYLSITTQRQRALKKAAKDAARRTYKYTFFIEIALIKTIPSLWMRKKYNVNVINKESSIILCHSKRERKWLGGNGFWHCRNGCGMAKAFAKNQSTRKEILHIIKPLHRARGKNQHKHIFHYQFSP